MPGFQITGDPRTTFSRSQISRPAQADPSPLRIFWLASCLLVLAACAQRPLEEGDRELVLTIGELQAYGLVLPDDFTAYETFKREQWFDGSVTIEYEFQPPAGQDLPYLYSVAEWHRSKGDACTSFSAGSFGMKLGAGDVVKRNDLFEYGDKSIFGLLVSEGNTYGNYFGMCDRKTAAMVVIGGFYFDDGNLWEELMSPSLNALSARAE